MNYNIYVFAGLFILSGCDQYNNQPTQAINKTAIYATEIRDYIRKNIEHYPPNRTRFGFQVMDSVRLLDLNTILYKVDDPASIDDNDYFLIQDCGNHEVYLITKRHWPSFNTSHDRALQIQILTNTESGKNIEMTDFDHIGFETFLNRSSELKNRPISDLELDTMIRFMADNELTRITKIEQIDTLLSKIDYTHDAEFYRLKHAHLLKVRPILEKKLKEKNILLYRLYWHPGITYFEIMPFVSTSFCQDEVGKEKKNAKKRSMNLINL